MHCRHQGCLSKQPAWLCRARKKLRQTARLREQHCLATTAATVLAPTAAANYCPGYYCCYSPVYHCCWLPLLRLSWPPLLPLLATTAATVLATTGATAATALTATAAVPSAPTACLCRAVQPGCPLDTLPGQAGPAKRWLAAQSSCPAGQT